MGRLPTRRLVAAFSILMLALAGVAMKFMPDHVVPAFAEELAPHAAHHDARADAGPEGEHRSYGRADCPFCRISDALAMPAPPSIPELVEHRIVHGFARVVFIPPDLLTLHARHGPRAPPAV